MAIIKDVKLSEQLLNDYMSYGMSTIVDRALPKVEDGFLPVQRKILFSMNQSKMTSDKEFQKTLDIQGNATKYYVHGDSSLVGALSLLVDSNQTQITPYILGHGNFGNVLTQGGYSAPRYTFAKLSKFSEDTLFEGLSDGIVDMIGDNDHKEPICLPTIYPNILTVYSKAIAVGEACSFNGFNLKDVCNYTSKYIKDRTLIASDYIIPDFPTRCKVIYNKNNIKNICDTGKGSIKLRGEYIIDKENNILTMYIPYSTTVERVVKEVTDKINNMKDITDIKDAIGFNQKTKQEEYAVDIYYKKNTDVNKLINLLYKNTSLESNVSYNMNCLIDFKPKVRGINEILDYWISFRESCIIKIKNKEISDKEQKLHLLIGLKKVLINIDKTIDIIRNSEEEKVLNNLMSEFNIDEIQAQYISDIKLKNINKTYIEKQIKQVDTLSNDIENLKYIVNNKEEIDNIIIEQLQYVSNKYGKPRQTEIVQEDDIQDFSKDDLIDDYLCNICYSDTYIKKHLKQSDNHKTKENEEIKETIKSNNTDTLLIFTDKANRYKIPCSELSTYTPSQLGDYIYNITTMDRDEKIIKIVSTPKDYKKDSYMVFVYDNGKVAKINIESYLSNNKKLQNCYNTDSKLIGIDYITKDVDIFLLSEEGKALIINTERINSKSSRNSQGVTGIKLNEGYNCIGAIINVTKDYNFKIETEKGKSKEFMLDDVVSSTDDRQLFKYLCGRPSNNGSFIYNTRPTNDKIIKFTKLN